VFSSAVPRPMRLALVASLVATSAALRLPSAFIAKAEQAVKTAVATTIAASLLVSPIQTPAAAPPTLNEAIVEFTEAIYPVIAVQNDAFPALTNELAALVFNSAKPAQMAKAIDISLDALLSVPPDRISAFNAVAKEAFDGLSPPSCQLAPLPFKSTVDSVMQTDALGMVDKARLKAYDEAWGATIKLLPKTDSYVAKDGKAYSVICLPKPDALDRLALAQAELGRSIGQQELKAFNDYVPAFLQSSVRTSDLIPLAQTASKMAYVPPEQKIRLQQATKSIESVAKAAAAQSKTEALKAQALANKAKLQAANEASKAKASALLQQ